MVGKRKQGKDLVVVFTKEVGVEPYTEEEYIIMHKKLERDGGSWVRAWKFVMNSIIVPHWCTKLIHPGEAPGITL